MGPADAAKYFFAPARLDTLSFKNTFEDTGIFFLNLWVRG